MNVGDRIKKRRMELCLSVDDVAKRTGKSRATIYRYESADVDNMPISTLEPIAKALHTSPAYLMGWEDDEYIPGIPPIKTKKFPVLGNIACGEPIFAEEQRDISVAGSADIRADFCLIAKGDSMTGARIYDGDIVFIRILGKVVASQTTFE